MIPARAILSILAGLCIGTQAFVIEAQPNRVDVNVTTDVKLSCFNDVSNHTDLVDIFRIRLEKLNVQEWKVIADHFDNGFQTMTFDPDISANGYIGDASNINATWPLATEDLVGEYRCEMIGMNKLNEFVVEKTDVVAIDRTDDQDTCEALLQTADQDLAGLRREFELFRAEMEAKMADLVNLTQSREILLLELIDNLQANLSSQVSELKQQQTDLVDTVTCMNGGTLTCDVSVANDQSWPNGTYGLYKPETGCPANSSDVAWSEGERKHHTEDASNNHDRVSRPSHLAAPVIETDGTNHYFYQRFCMADSSQGAEFPKGSYCINRKGGNCPPGFGSGYIFIDDETTLLDSISGDLPDGQYASHTQIYYCCRSDSPADEPITLPTSAPFYLYRHKDPCQAVKNMNVAVEWLEMDTDNSDNADKYQNSNHPDGKLDDLRLDLCYYS